MEEKVSQGLNAKNKDLEKELCEVRDHAQELQILHDTRQGELLDIKAKEVKTLEVLREQGEAKQLAQSAAHAAMIEIVDLKKENSATKEELNEKVSALEILQLELEEVKQNMEHEVEEERKASQVLEAQVEEFETKQKRAADFFSELFGKEAGALKRADSEDSDKSETRRRKTKVGNDENALRIAARKSGMLRAILVYGTSMLTSFST